MKKFYLHNGKDQQGPFDIEDLKSKNINKESSIWFEGLSEWTSADKIDELQVLFSKTTPPPFSAKTTTPPSLTQQTTNSQHKAPKKKNTLGIILQLIGGVGAIIIIVMIIISNMNKGGSGQTYQEKVMTVEEIERSQPTNFLTADGNYNENFWGDIIKVHGVIKNTATVASYKEAVVRVTYYSKTKTELGSNEYTIYENFPPHSEVKFELEIKNYKDVNSIGWDVIQATGN